MSDANLAQKAINHALSGEWEDAVKTNLEILEKNKTDIDALNRLARAYSELGQIKNARNTAKKVLKIDSSDPIAQKSLEKWKNLKEGESSHSHLSRPDQFLEEPGKTKIIKLMHVNKTVLSKVDAGDKVNINSHSHRISITTTEGKKIGRLPDDLSAHLKKLIKYGNEYEAIIKSLNKDGVTILIRETKRSKHLANIPSFSSEKIEYVSFTPPELVHGTDTPDTSTTEDSE